MATAMQRAPGFRFDEQNRQPPANIEAEQALLGALLLDNRQWERVVAILQPEHFADPVHGKIYSAISNLLTKGTQANPITLAAYCEAEGSLADRGGHSYLARLAASTITTMNSPDYARQIIDLWQRRMVIQAAQDAIDDAYDVSLDRSGAEITADTIDALARMGQEGPFRFRTAREVRLNSLDAMKIDLPRTSTGYARLDKAMWGGLYAGKMYGIMARKKAGKAQPLTAKVLTVAGWKLMGHIAEGDELASPDGQQSRVIGVFPRGEMQVFRVTLSDGRSTECSADHLWTVGGYNNSNGQPRKWETIDTTELARRTALSRPIFLPWFSGEYGRNESLPIDPYTLGILIGDGCLADPKAVMVSTADEFILDEIRASLTGTDEIVHRAAYDYCIRGGRRGGDVSTRPRNRTKEALTSLGLMGKLAYDKFIPESYLAAPREQRLALLQGLLDSDGFTDGRSISFCSVSERLANEVMYLVRSLGGAARCSKKKTTHAAAFMVNIRHPDGASLFRLPRKRGRLATCRKHQPRLRVMSVEPIGMAPVQCISVSHPDGLYITDDFIVTHNTMMGGGIAMQAARWRDRNQLGGHIAYIAGEMGGDEIEQRQWAAEMRRNSTTFLSRRHNDDFWRQASDTASNATDTLLYLDIPGLTLEKLRRALAQFVMTWPDATGFVLDYIQLVRGRPKGMNGAEFMDEVADWLAAFCKERKVWGLVLAQENQEGNVRGGEGLRLACDMAFELARSDEGQGDSAWLTMIETRYTSWLDVGTAADPAFQLETKTGPYYREIPALVTEDEASQL